MAEQGRAGGRVGTWPEIAASWARRAPVFGDGLARFLESLGLRFTAWVQADTAPGHLFPWLPVAVGAGIVLYFAAETEPAWWAGAVVTALTAIAAFGLRARPVAFPVILTLAALAVGFTVATLRAAYVAHPILAYPASGVEIAGFVETREAREKTDRIAIRVGRIDGARLSARPERVRLSLRKGTAPPVGSYVVLKARLNPPLQPLRPGGYDFARDLYFQRIGAIGFALGHVKIVEPPAPPGLWTRYVAAIGAMREVVDARIRAAIPGDRAAIASALLTGTRDAITPSVNDALYVSSLGHVLSISGYHMAVVAGIVFFAVRGLLALVPFLATRHPIKKWAAAAALFAATFYLLLSGAEVATQRSYVMTAIVLVGVMFDRAALTFRTISIAALAVLLTAPEAVVHPSFQMSFAATLALISGYRNGLPWFSSVPDTALGTRIALWGGREIAALTFASLLAGFATTLYVGFHFHRLAPYGVIANLAAMPVVSVWVMPMGMLAILAIPFGFDGVLWRAMAEGIDWMMLVAQWVANLPGAVGRISAFGAGPLLLGSAGLIVICLLRTPLRWSGAVAMGFAALWIALTPQPDILVSADGQIAAIRRSDGRLSILKRNNDDFVVREWLAASADARPPRDATLSDGVRCDPSGCVGQLSNSALVALSIRPDAIEEDCLRAAVVVGALDIPSDCAAIAIDRMTMRAAGAVALYRNGNSFDVVRARPRGQDRPWARSVEEGGDSVQRPAGRAHPRDATPRPEDVDPTDQ